jgi:hypothetical protein
LRPRLTTGLPFSLTHTQGCACLATNTSYIGSQAHAIKAWRNFREGPKGELLRIPIPRTRVNKGKRKGEENSRPSVGLHTFADQFVGVFEAHPTMDPGLLVALEALVDFEELLDLAQVPIR